MASRSERLTLAASSKGLCVQALTQNATCLAVVLSRLACAIDP